MAESVPVRLEMQQSSHRLEFVLVANRLYAQCVAGDWSRDVHDGRRGEPFALTSFHHWTHQLEIQKREGRY